MLWNMNIGQFNVRGCKEQHKKDKLFRDFEKYQLDILCLSETHIPEEEDLYENNKYSLFTVNKANSSKHGAGLLVRSSYKPLFEKITDRICKATVAVDNRCRALEKPLQKKVDK